MSEKKSRIKPQTLRGFRDFLPDQMMAREHLIQTARNVYRSYGFAPIDTPALEYAEVLLGKGGDESDKQVFRFRDQGDRDVAMRFDLTVPLARFSAQHVQSLGTPFRRYHVGPVWRGERPARGRYREFIQCDFDTIGTRSNASDIETMMVINDLFEALKIESFTIRINNRKVLNGLLQQHDMQDQAVAILRVLDKLDKIGAEAVRKELIEAVGISEQQADGVLSLVQLSGTPVSMLDQLETLLAGNEVGQQGVADLRELFQVAGRLGLPTGRVKLDVSIARGLDYYTGTIFETVLGDLPGIGSVCSGGRYDNLAELFTAQELPGVGASLGVDRMLAAMEELGLVKQATTPAPVLVTMFADRYLAEYSLTARRLRAAGIGAEIYPEAKAIGKQLKYADKRGFRVALIAGEDDFERGVFQVKNLKDGGQQESPEAQLVDVVSAALADESA